MNGIGQVLLLLRLCKDRRLLTECDDANLNQAKQVGVGVTPLVKIWQIDLPCSVHMF